MSRPEEEEEEREEEDGRKEAMREGKISDLKLKLKRQTDVQGRRKRRKRSQL